MLGNKGILILGFGAHSCFVNGIFNKGVTKLLLSLQLSLLTKIPPGKEDLDFMVCLYQSWFFRTLSALFICFVRSHGLGLLTLIHEVEISILTSKSCQILVEGIMAQQ